MNTSGNNVTAAVQHQPLVAVVVPVFNAAEYLTDTVLSIFSQTYPNWQLLLIDDCSTDASLNICENFASGESRITVLRNEKNLGPAHTRNRGIDYAVTYGAKYVSFVDSDDTVTPDYLEKLVLAAEQTNADIVWCNYWECNATDSARKSLMQHHLPCGTPLDGKRPLALFFNGPTGLGSLWDKLYGVEFVTRTGIRINPERVRAEDWEFNLMLFQQHPRVVPIADALYNYVHHPHPSVMSSYRTQDYELFWRSRQLLEEMATANGLVYDKEKENATILYHIVNHLLILSKAANVADKRAELMNIANDARLHELLDGGEWRYKDLPHSFKCVVFLLKHHYSWLLRLYLGIR